MHIRLIISMFILAFVVLSCSSPDIKQKKEPPKNVITEKQHSINILDTIIEKKKLRAITDYGSLSYLVYRGTPIGYQYEMLKALTNYLGVELDLVIERDMHKSIEMLENQQTDLLAIGLTVTNSRKEYLCFTNPIFTTRQVLVQRKPEGYYNMATADEIDSYLIRNPIDLGGKTIHVQKGTVFSDKLRSLSNDIGDSINIIEEDMEMEELIEAVANDSIDYTVADEHVAEVYSRNFPEIDVKTHVSFQQKIAWAAKKGQEKLIDTINCWLEEFNKSITARLLYNKYFKNIRAKRIANSRYNSYSGVNLSPYDEEIKEGAAIIGWDWRLLASLIYQESQFKPNVQSWVGAYGLMQLMPEVMKKYNIDSLSTVKEHLNAGINHLINIQNQLPPEITDSVEKVKFVLASYNCGIGHVLDARRIAERFNKNPNVWTTETDSCILALSKFKTYSLPEVYYGYTRGEETYNFVNEIINRYNIYCQLIN